jgi:hypothetical protein
VAPGEGCAVGNRIETPAIDVELRPEFFTSTATTGWLYPWAMSCFISSSLIEPARVIAPFAFRVPDRTMTFTRLPDRKKLAACHPSDSTPRVTPVAANSVVARSL